MQAELFAVYQIAYKERTYGKGGRNSEFKNEYQTQDKQKLYP